jgi:glycosyltransferase involved in cell wall biosynthesis
MRRPLRIAFIGARGVGGSYSGIETYYEEVGSRLAARSHSVTAYCRRHFTPNVPLYKGIQVRLLPALRNKHLETASHSFLSTLDALRRSYDIVQYHAIGSAPLALLPRVRGVVTVVSVRGLDWQRAKWGRTARAALKFGEWASARAPTATVVVSNTLRQHYLETHGAAVHVIPNAVSRPARVEADQIRKFGLEKDGFVLFAGRLSPEKGVHTLIEAMRPFAGRMTLALAGGSSYSDGYIESLRKSAFPGVSFLGNVDKTLMAELYSNCYAYVLPSAMEGLSVGLLEALTYGNCILTTDIPENSEVIGSAGIQFGFDDVDGLREGLRRVIDRPEVMHEYRAKAAARAAALPTWDDVATLTEELYYDLLDAHARNGRSSELANDKPAINLSSS